MGTTLEACRLPRLYSLEEKQVQPINAKRNILPKERIQGSGAFVAEGQHVAGVTLTPHKRRANQTIQEARDDTNQCAMAPLNQTKRARKKNPTSTTTQPQILRLFFPLF